MQKNLIKILSAFLIIVCFQAIHISKASAASEKEIKFGETYTIENYRGLFDENHYIKVEKRGFLKININSTTSDFVFNLKGPVSESIDPKNNQLKNYEISVEPGNYFISFIFPTEMDKLTYSVDFTANEYIEMEYNDSRQFANSIKEGQWYTGKINNSSDSADYFKLDIPKNGLYQLTVAQNKETKWKFGVEGVNTWENIVTKLNSSNNSLTFQAEKGQIFLDVTELAGKSNWQNKYKFKITRIGNQTAAFNKKNIDIYTSTLGTFLNVKGLKKGEQFGVDRNLYTSEPIISKTAKGTTVFFDLVNALSRDTSYIYVGYKRKNEMWSLGTKVPIKLTKQTPAISKKNVTIKNVKSDLKKDSVTIKGLKKGQIVFVTQDKLFMDYKLATSNKETIKLKLYNTGTIYVAVISPNHKASKFVKVNY